MTCRYAVSRVAFSLTSKYWEEGDGHDQGRTRDGHDIVNLLIISDWYKIRIM